MIERIIEFSIRNRFIVILLALVTAAWGIYCVINTPVDAIPDLSENQVIVFTDWMGRSPQEIEDQITYPLSKSLSGLAGMKTITWFSERSGIASTGVLMRAWTPHATTPRASRMTTNRLRIENSMIFSIMGAESYEL